MSASASASATSSPTPTQTSLARPPKPKAEGETYSTERFPLGYRPAFSQWWASISPADAEHTVLSFIPYLQKPPTDTQTGFASAWVHQSTMSIDADPAKEAAPVQTNSINDPHGPRAWYSNLIQLSGTNRVLNEFSVERVGEEVEENLVMLHGYGIGLGFFYKNFEGLSQVSGWKIYALDMLGMGRSSRPPFRIHAKDKAGKITEAENWFIDALEEWRVLKKINKFTLLGHSMGGYMAVAYALKYPGHLKKLILASPVGIPEDPSAVQAEMPELEDLPMAGEFTQDQEDHIVNSSGSVSPAPLNIRSKTKPPTNKLTQNNQPPRSRISKWVSYLWDANMSPFSISPFSIVRWAGPVGPRLISGWTSRCFSHLPGPEAEALHHYAYSLFRQRGSGEFVLAYVLAPGALARSPLIRRIGGVGRQPIPAASTSTSTSAPSTTPPAAALTKETGYPIVLIYGENDWMDIAGGYATVQKFKEEREKALRSASELEKAKENGSAKVLIIKKATHHVYLDGWEEFNEVVREEMEETLRWDRAFGKGS